MPNYLNMMPTIKKPNSQSTMKMGMSHQRNLVVKRSAPVQDNSTKGIDFRSMKNNLKNNNRSGCSACSGTF